MSSLQLVSAYPYGEKWDPVLLNGLLSTIVLDSITGSEILSETITATNLATNSVTADKIIAGAVSSIKIAANTIIADNIATDAITTTKLQAGSVTADKIEAGAVTSSKIAADAIDSSHISANSITADDIASNAVTSDKILAEAITTEKLYAGAVTSTKISVAELSSISANLGTVTAGTLTAGTVQTSADPTVNRVKMDIGGLTGYSSTLGQVFKLPTDGSAPIFSSGNILSGTIIDTTIISNNFRTSDMLPYLSLTDDGLAFNETGGGSIYNDFVYGDGSKYGSGVSFYIGNASKPVVSVETDRTAYADIRLYNKADVPTGESVVGDLICHGGELKLCTTLGTPGTYSIVYRAGGTDVAIADGGTGKSSWTQYLIPYADTTTSLSQIAIGTDGQVLTSGGAGVAPSFETLPTELPSSATMGDLTYYDGYSWVKIPIGTAGQTLQPGYDSYTKIQSSFDGADAATAYTDPIAGAYTFAGTAQLDTAQKKFGTASLLLDGDSDYVTLPDSADWNFGTGDFTIDFQVRFAVFGASSQHIIAQYEDSSNRWYVSLGADKKFNIVFVDDGSTKAQYVSSSAWTGVTDTWYHIAIVRSTTSILMFIDGVAHTLSAATPISTNDVGDIAAVLTIGANPAGPNYFNGWIDELRISKGIARWTADFTPPTSAYGLVPAWIT